jgi:hypothetical protein
MMQTVDDATFRLATHNADIMQYRVVLTQLEVDNAIQRLGLRIGNGGAGFATCSQMAEAAFLGTWAKAVPILKRNGFPLEILLPHSSTMADVSFHAAKMRAAIDASALIDRQRSDTSWDTGKKPVRGILLCLEDQAAIRKEHTDTLARGREHQHRINTVWNLASANLVQKRLEEDGRGQACPWTRAFIAQRSSAAANAFLMWAHKYPKKRQLTHRQLAITLWSALGVPVSIDAYICRHCAAPNCEFYEHSEQCTKARFRTKVDGTKVFSTRAIGCHEALQKAIVHALAMIPDVTIRGLHPMLLDMFAVADGQVLRLESQAAADNRRNNEIRARPDNLVVPPAEVGVQDGRLTPPLAQPEPQAVRQPVQEAADIELAITFPNAPAAVVIDHTVSGVHAKSNLRHCYGEDVYTSGIANVGQKRKDLKHRVYETGGKAWGFGMDSLGGCSDDMAKHLLHLYARSTIGDERRWDSEALRVACKRLFVCSVSCVLARHRALDYMHQGIPNHRRGGRQEGVHNLLHVL